MSDENKELIVTENTEDEVTAKKPSKKKLIIIILVIIIALLGASFGGYFELKPMVSYSTATKLVEQGDYDKAIEMFESLDDYKDSADKVLETKYLKAKSLIEGKDYAKAIDVLNEISDYKDSSDLRIECIYQLAVQAVEKEDFKEARRQLDSITDSGKTEYKDSKKLYSECVRLEKEAKKKADYDKANKLMKEKKYEEAIKIYESLSEENYKDSYDLYIESLYIAYVDYVKDVEKKVNNGEEVDFYEDSYILIQANCLLDLEYKDVYDWLDKYNELYNMYSAWDLDIYVNENKSNNNLSNSKDNFFNAEYIVAHIKVNKKPQLYKNKDKFKVCVTFRYPNVILGTTETEFEKTRTLKDNTIFSESIHFGYNDDYDIDQSWYSGPVVIEVTIDDEFVIEKTINLDEDKSFKTTINFV